MRKLVTAEDVEEIIGKVPPVVLLKAIDTFDEGCSSVFAHASIAGFGFRDRNGVPHTTFVGGGAGFTRMDSPTSISFEISARSPRPATGGASMLYFLPGLGETLRLNGLIVELSGDRVTIDLQEAFIHCARCVMRANLWQGVPTERNPHTDEVQLVRDAELSGPLSRPDVADFLSAVTFLLISSWNADGDSDTSPKGDPVGFVRIIDGYTLAIPNRSGNRRADTLYNLTTCDGMSLAALVPGREDVLHLSGTAYATDDLELRSTMALKGSPPNSALVISVDRAEIMLNEAVRASRIWDPAAHVDRSQAPDLLKVSAQHMAQNKQRGALASVARVLSRGMIKSPKLSGRAMDVVYRKTLESEGYDAD